MAPPSRSSTSTGLVFFAWFILLIAQTSLIAGRRVHVHRRLGWVGAGLAVLVVTIGTLGSLIAARRPTGFIDVPMPPLQFLVVPLSLMVLFAGFVSLAIIKRRDPQSHKRYMLAGDDQPDRGWGSPMALRIHQGGFFDSICQRA